MATNTTTEETTTEETTTEETTEGLDGTQTTDWDDSNDAGEADRLESARSEAVANYAKEQE
jgi:hypothetical protein